MVFILNAKKDFEGAQLGPCEAHWGPIKMAHDWAKSGNSVGTHYLKRFNFLRFVLLRLKLNDYFWAYYN